MTRPPNNTRAYFVCPVTTPYHNSRCLVFEWLLQGAVIKGNGAHEAAGERDKGVTDHG